MKNLWNDLGKYVKRKAKSKTDDKIKKARENLDGDNEIPTENIDGIDSDVSISDDELKFDNIKTKEKKGKKRKKRAEDEELNKNGDFFEDVALGDANVSFYQMNLSRPLMKAISDMKFVHPTPIQAATIPNALLGELRWFLFKHFQGFILFVVIFTLRDVFTNR